MRILKRRVHSRCFFCGRPKLGRHCRRCNHRFRNAQIRIDRRMEPLKRAIAVGAYGPEVP